MHGLEFAEQLLVLPNQVLESMKATPFSCDTNSKDSLIWAYSKDGSLSFISLLSGKRLKSLEPAYCFIVMGMEDFYTSSGSILPLAMHAQ